MSVNTLLCDTLALADFRHFDCFWFAGLPGGHPLHKLHQRSGEGIVRRVGVCVSALLSPMAWFFISVWRISGKVPANVSATVKFSGLFLQRFRPPPTKFTPKRHAQNCRCSSPISDFQTQCLFTTIFCLPLHKRITKLIPKRFRFGNSSTKITEHNSHSNSVKDSVILCSHYLPRPINSRNKSVR